MVENCHLQHRQSTHA